jgi:hypothetical protein
MTDFTSTAATAILTLISGTGVWLLLSVLYRDYRIDVFRENLFALRAELFDLARRGEIAFDHPAYVDLRTTINGWLRFADRISLLQVMLTARLVKSRGPVELKPWEKYTRRLEPGLRAELAAIRDRMHFELLKQVVLTSPLLMLTLLPPLGVVLLQLAGKKLFWRLYSPAYRWCERQFERFSAPLDAAAFEIGANG